MTKREIAKLSNQQKFVLALTDKKYRNTVMRIPYAWLTLIGLLCLLQVLY